MIQPRSLSGPRASFAVLLGCALMLRALVPMGWMPVADRGFRIELCTGVPDSPAAIAAQREAEHMLAAAIGTSGKPSKDHHGGKSPDQPCVFAGLGTPWASPASIVVPALATIPERAVPAFSLAAAIGRGLAAPPPPATGPPLLS